eukprot:EG_transcript_21578
MNGLCAILFLLICLVNSKEVLLEVSFDISPKEQTETGFKATDTLQLYLQSPKMKWLRSFHMLISSATSNKPQRVAFMAFRDTLSWAEFEEEHLVKTHALYDHFWLNSRRVLWREVDQVIQYPSHERSMERSGGFIWCLKYSLKDGKEESWKKFWGEKLGDVIPALKENEGFVESHSYSTRNMLKSFQHMVMWEFLGMRELAEAVYDNPAMQVIFDALPHYCSDWTSTVLAPPADENGKQIGFFYPAAGADPPAEEQAEGQPEREL